MRRKLIAGNWKMFKTNLEATDFAKEMKILEINKGIDVVVCPPFTSLLTLVSEFQDIDIKVGAQNMHYEESGAFTGEISPSMLSDLNVDYCIIGHSERREYFNETDDSINKKIKKAIEHNIIPVLCVGENLNQREAGNAEIIVENQLKADLEGIEAENVKNIVIAYEPIWAIGTGVTASKEQANEMIGFIRKTIIECFNEETGNRIRILYGGSVKPENAKELMNMSEIDGALVGGASLKPIDFIKIINF